MIYLTLAMLLVPADQSVEAVSRQNIAVARRLVAAIKGKSDFQDADFAKSLSEPDRSALRRFGVCKVKFIDHPGSIDPKEPEFMIPDFDRVSVGLNCEGVSAKTPVALSLHLQNGKIATIETHNADLMGVR